MSFLSLLKVLSSYTACCIAFFKQLAVLNTAGWEDTVLWNPYGNEGMGFDNFVCVESVKFDPVTLEGGSSWTGDMALKPGSL
jgi:glucose-6-phosphate 1-epimerase